MNNVNVIDVTLLMLRHSTFGGLPIVNRVILLLRHRWLFNVVYILRICFERERKKNGRFMSCILCNCLVHFLVTHINRENDVGKTETNCIM